MTDPEPNNGKGRDEGRHFFRLVLGPAMAGFGLYIFYYGLTVTVGLDNEPLPFATRLLILIAGSIMLGIGLFAIIFAHKIGGGGNGRGGLGH